MSTYEGRVLSQRSMWLNMCDWLNCGQIARKDIVEFYLARKHYGNRMGDDFRKGKR